MNKLVLCLVISAALIAGCGSSNPSGTAGQPGNTTNPDFVGYWKVGGWSFISSMGGPYTYTSGGDSCFLDIKANGTYSGWAIRYYNVRKSTGTWTADDYYITFASSDGWDDQVTWQVSNSQTSANLNLVASGETGVIHEMCSR